MVTMPRSWSIFELTALVALGRTVEPAAAPVE
jgi:hypothetical protein